MHFSQVLIASVVAHGAFAAILPGGQEGSARRKLAARGADRCWEYEKWCPDNRDKSGHLGSCIDKTHECCPSGNRCTGGSKCHPQPSDPTFYVCCKEGDDSVDCGGYKGGDSSTTSAPVSTTSDATTDGPYVSSKPTPVIEPMPSGYESASISIQPIESGYESATPIIEPMPTGYESASISIQPIESGYESVTATIEPMPTGYESASISIQPIESGYESATPIIEPMPTGYESATPIIEPYPSGYETMSRNHTTTPCTTATIKPTGGTGTVFPFPTGIPIHKGKGGDDCKDTKELLKLVIELLEKKGSEKCDCEKEKHGKGKEEKKDDKKEEKKDDKKDDKYDDKY